MSLFRSDHRRRHRVRARVGPRPPCFGILRRGTTPVQRLADLVRLMADPRLLLVLGQLTRGPGREDDLVRLAGTAPDDVALMLRLLRKQHLLRRRRIRRGTHWYGTSPHLGEWVLQAYRIAYELPAE
jgi:hypothetical protein